MLDIFWIYVKLTSTSQHFPLSGPFTSSICTAGFAGDAGRSPAGATGATAATLPVSSTRGPHQLRARRATPDAQFTWDARDLRGTCAALPADKER